MKLGQRGLGQARLDLPAGAGALVHCLLLTVHRVLCSPSGLLLFHLGNGRSGHVGSFPALMEAD